jgi:hypothetical protein
MRGECSRPLSRVTRGGEMYWCWRCLAVEFRSLMRSPNSLALCSTFSWCESLEFQDTRSSQWVRSRRAASAFNDELVSILGLSNDIIESIASAETRELARREQIYRAGRPPLEIEEKTVILVDDGLATGSTMRAAVLGLRQREPRWVVIGVPIAAPSTCKELSADVDDIVCAVTPEPFCAVGVWYADFSQTSDEEVRELLKTSTRELPRRQLDRMAGGAGRS